MFSIRGTTISLTRGDSAAFALDIDRENADGTREPYEMQNGDVLTLTVRRSLHAPGIMLEVHAEAGVFQISPQDTKNMLPMDYVYDIELKTAGGDVYTVVGSDGINVPKFEVLPEVTL